MFRLHSLMKWIIEKITIDVRMCACAVPNAQRIPRRNDPQIKWIHASSIRPVLFPQKLSSSVKRIVCTHTHTQAHRDYCCLLSNDIKQLRSSHSCRLPAAVSVAPRIRCHPRYARHSCTLRTMQHTLKQYSYFVHTFAGVQIADGEGWTFRICAPPYLQAKCVMSWWEGKIEWEQRRERMGQ